MNNHYSSSSRIQVDTALAAIDAEEERQKQAVEAFYAREASLPVMNWKWALLGLFIGGALAALGCWWLITQALDRFQP